MSILILASVIFKGWMVFDAAQRGGACCGNIWLYVVLFPFGDLIYFFTIKIHDPEIACHIAPLFVKKPKLEDIEREAKHCPSIQNKRKLAAALHQVKRHEECLKLCQEIHILDSNDKQNLYLQGLALKNLGRHTEANFILEAVVEGNFSFAEYGAAANLAEVLLDSGKKEEGISLLETVAKKSGNIDHYLKLMEVLLKLDEKQRAKECLEKMTHDFESSPRYIQRKQKRVFKKAKALVTQIQ